MPGPLAVRGKTVPEQTIPEKVRAARLVQLLQRVERLFEQLVPDAFPSEGFELFIDGGEVARKLIESRTRLRDPLVERTRGIGVVNGFGFHGVGIGHVFCLSRRSARYCPVSSTASDNLS